LYCSQNIIRIVKSRRMSRAGQGRTCNAQGEMRNAYKILVGKPEETTLKT
jgi:hypothetical protein